VNDKCRDICIFPKGRWEATERGLAIQNGMRLISKLTDGAAVCLPDLNRRGSEVASSNIRELASNTADHLNPALNGANFRLDEVTVHWPAEVVSNKVPSGIVDVKAVRHIVTVESKFGPVYLNSYVQGQLPWYWIKQDNG
jgi:hypothetical protein